MKQLASNVMNLIEIRGMSFTRGERLIFADINMTVPRGKVTAIMGPSGIGKTTLLRLIGGQLAPDTGEIWFDGDNIPALSRQRLYDVRKKMSMLFQSGALFTDLTVFENVAFPLREHSRLPEELLHSTVMMKLEAVGLRGAANLMPAELSGGMARRAACAGQGSGGLGVGALVEGGVDGNERRRERALTQEIPHHVGDTQRRPAGVGDGPIAEVVRK